MKKRWILAAVLAIALCVTCFLLLPADAQAEDIASGTCGDNLTWVLDDSGTLTISGTGKMADYSEGSSPWYAKRTKITAVVIEDGVTSIGSCAFYACLKMIDISIADSVTSIGDYAFQDCTKLTSVDIPDGVTVIRTGTFSGCTSITSVAIPDSVTSIQGGFFDYDGAFYNCSSLESVYITDIAAWCEIDFEDYASNPLNKVADLYLNGELLTDLVIPDSVTSIGSSAFYGCSSLTSVTIPDGVTSIGSSAFRDCSSLESITIPDGVTSIGNYAFCYCSSLTSVTIGDGVTSIGDCAFYYCSSLTSITIPDGVTSIGDCAFYDCSSLTSVTIGDGVTSIGGSAFAYCSSLTSITIPDGVTSIGWGAFYDCSSLTSVTIGDGVTSIRDDAFAFCSSLWHVLYKGTEADWKAISIDWYGNYKLTSATRHYECIGDEVSEEITLVPTCTETGTRVHTCFLCGESKEITLSALGHKWQPATCTDPKTCLRCSITEGEPLEGSNGHEYTSVVTPPTCAEQGYTTYTCTRCSYSYVGDYTETLPHNWGGSVATEPTCTAQGYTTYTCADCGHIHTEYDVEPLGHDYKGVYTPPTYTKEGFTTFTCSRCGDSYVDNFVEKLDLVIGDVDGDGDADSADAMWILRYDAWEIDRFPIQEMIGDSLDMALNLRDALDLHSQTCGTPASQQSGAGLSNYVCSICANGNALGSLSAPAMKPAQLQQAVTPVETESAPPQLFALILSALFSAAITSGAWLIALKKKK